MLQPSTPLRYSGWTCMFARSQVVTQRAITTLESLSLWHRFTIVPGYLSLIFISRLMRMFVNYPWMCYSAWNLSTQFESVLCLFLLHLDSAQSSVSLQCPSAWITFLLFVWPWLIHFGVPVSIVYIVWSKWFDLIWNTSCSRKSWTYFQCGPWWCVVSKSGWPSPRQVTHFQCRLVGSFTSSGIATR